MKIALPLLAPVASVRGHGRRSSPSPYASFFRRMSRFFLFSGRILLFCLPQTLLSLGAIWLYTEAVICPPITLGIHVPLILAFHIFYFGGWLILLGRNPAMQSRWVCILYALIGSMKWLMLNLVYLASYASYRLWGAYISWDNLRALMPHLRGFYLALGSDLFIALGIIALFLFGYLLLALKTAQRSLSWLRSTHRGPIAIAHILMLAAWPLLLACWLWLAHPQSTEATATDPILAFWSNQAAAELTLTPDMLADRAVGQAYQVPASFRRRNVIIFIIDCMRSSHLSFNGYPRATTPYLASLEREGFFQKVGFAVSNGNDSPQGIRTILNSRYPHQHNIHNFRLQDVLKQAGYRTHVIATGDHTTLGGMRQHYGPNLDVFSDGLSTKAYSVNDDRILLEALAKIKPSDGQPAFFFFHLMSAHTLGVHDPAFARWRPALLKMEWGAMVLGQYNTQLFTNTYDNGLVQADHFTERIFADLRTKGYLGDYIGVITGDHGEGMGERGNYGHTRFLYSEDINVPILFFESTPVDYGPMPFASHVDIAPTLLNRLGLPEPARWNGRSLFQAPPPEVTYASGTRNSGWRAVLKRDNGEIYKYLFYGTKLRAFQELLYHESKDPQELVNLATEASFNGILMDFRQLASSEFKRSVPPSD